MSTRQPSGEGAARFRALLRDRIAEIEGTWHDWRAAPDQVGAMHQLRAVVHRLAGSATANHIAEIGGPAQRLDALLSGWQDEEVELRATPAELAGAVEPVVGALLHAMAHAAALGLHEPVEHASSATDFGVPIHVLFLEDDAEQRSTWARALEREGLRVRVATNEDELEALLALERPDVLLIDYWLGQRTAAEVAQGLRASREYADIPRVCLTIDAGVQPRQSAMEAGYSAVLRKSIQPGDLARVLRQAVANASRT